MFEQMRRKTVAKCMTVSMFGDFGLFDRSADRFLNRRFGSVMPARFAVFARRRDFGRGKHILPFPFLSGVRVFSRKRERHPDFAEAAP